MSMRAAHIPPLCGFHGADLHQLSTLARRLQKDTERAEAISILDDAVKGGRGDAVLLRRALQAGRTAGLEGDGWYWTLPCMHTSMSD